MNNLLTVVLELSHIRVDFINPSGAFRKANSVAGRGVPAADCFQLAVVVVTGPVF